MMPVNFSLEQHRPFRQTAETPLSLR